MKFTGRKFTAEAILGSDDYVIKEPSMGSLNGFKVVYVKDSQGNIYKVKSQGTTRKETDLENLRVELQLILGEPEGRWSNIRDLVCCYHCFSQ